VGSGAAKKTNFMYLGVTKHFWLIDNLVYNKGLWVDLTSSGGGDFPPWPNLETVCLHSPLCERPWAEMTSKVFSAWLQLIMQTLDALIWNTGVIMNRTGRDAEGPTNSS